eukprot:g4608.t1
MSRLPRRKSRSTARAASPAADTDEEEASSSTTPALFESRDKEEFSDTLQTGERGRRKEEQDSGRPSGSGDATKQGETSDDDDGGDFFESAELLEAGMRRVRGFVRDRRCTQKVTDCFSKTHNELARAVFEEHLAMPAPDERDKPSGSNIPRHTLLRDAVHLLTALEDIESPIGTTVAATTARTRSASSPHQRPWNGSGYAFDSSFQNSLFPDEALEQLFFGEWELVRVISFKTRRSTGDASTAMMRAELDEVRDSIPEMVSAARKADFPSAFDLLGPWLVPRSLSYAEQCAVRSGAERRRESARQTTRQGRPAGGLRSLRDRLSAECIRDPRLTPLCFVSAEENDETVAGTNRGAWPSDNQDLRTVAEKPTLAETEGHDVLLSQMLAAVCQVMGVEPVAIARTGTDEFSEAVMLETRSAAQCEGEKDRQAGSAVENGGRDWWGRGSEVAAPGGSGDGGAAGALDELAADEKRQATTAGNADAMPKQENAPEVQDVPRERAEDAKNSYLVFNALVPPTALHANGANEGGMGQLMTRLFLYRRASPTMQLASDDSLAQMLQERAVHNRNATPPT